MPVDVADLIVQRVNIPRDSMYVNGSVASCFVVTKCDKPPLVTLANIGGFPYVNDYYASNEQVDGKWGVRLVFRCSGAVPAQGTGAGIEVCIGQVGLNPPPNGSTYDIISHNWT